jgi:hypothetical protein
MTTQAEIAQRNHSRAVRFFWRLLVGATLISLVGNVAHAVLPYIPKGSPRLARFRLRSQHRRSCHHE